MVLLRQLSVEHELDIRVERIVEVVPPVPGRTRGHDNPAYYEVLEVALELLSKIRKTRLDDTLVWVPESLTP